METDSTEAKKKQQQCSGILCPHCGGISMVQNGKPMNGIHGRYRKCMGCGTTFYTEESVVRIIKVQTAEEKVKPTVKPVQRKK